MMKAESYLPASTRIFRWWPSGAQYRSNTLVFRRLFLLPNFVAAQQTYNHNSKLELRKKKKRKQRIEQNSNCVSSQQQLQIVTIVMYKAQIYQQLHQSYFCAS